MGAHWCATCGAFVGVSRDRYRRIFCSEDCLSRDPRRVRKAEIQRLRTQGASMRTIATELGISVQAVSQSLRANGDPLRRGGPSGGCVTKNFCV